MDLGLPQNDNALGYGIITLLFVISTVAVLLRLYARFIVLHQPSVGDFLLIGGYAFWTTCVALAYGLGHNPGLFVHASELPHNPAVLVSFLHTVFLLSLLLSIYVPLLKAAIMCEWLHIFVPKGTRNFVFWACHLVLWSNVVFYFVIVVLECIACTPLEYSWDKRIVGGHCNIFDSAWLGVVTSGVNLLTDIAILIIPQRVIWKLNMSRAKKLGVSVIFAIGVLGVIAAVVRTVYIVRSAGEYTTDYTFGFSSVVLSVLAEGTCVILVMCIPAAPRAVAALPNMVSSMRSWAGNSVEWLRASTRPSTRSASTRWGRSRPFGSSKGSDEYANLDEHHLTSLPASTVSTNAQHPKSDNMGRGQWGGIVRETQFDATSSEADGTNTAKDRFERQHPWADGV
ncbi:Uu.00g130610.m01.CDS01 [Anthostomella pinea]|uniref:Uu.00g130610.m01.CDS01 n=1 Tax=Anthostomella pinea TaxID=933095 RepID=A0AAI8VIT5_9PEZI|nr:Uu.00g130610.m01.CDS01 [Anthostomella pinea]